MAEPAPAAVTFDDVSVSVPRRRTPVLDRIDLRVRAGEHVVVLGASGSGKSTLLQCITGVVPHSVNAHLGGEVRVAGTATTDVPVVELSRHVGVLAQDPSAAVCLPDVEQELALPLENHAADPATIGPRIDAALREVGAAHLRGRATGELSGGEAQRVALAAALITDRRLLLLDEPTSMLDPAGVRDVRTALTAAVDRSGAAVVLVEHRLDDLAGAEGLAGLPARAVVLDEDGRLLADGPTTQLLREHARPLRDAGCWLPLESELQALTGDPGGLSSPVNRAALDSLATGGDTPDCASASRRPGETVLRAAALTVAHRSSPAVLSGIDLELDTGEVVALLGPNGVGKTTLLLTLAGLLPPVAGAVEGERAGMVFQDAEHQFVAHTVAEEVAHGLTGPVEEIVARQLRTHRLEHLAGHNPFRLSGGEKRRLSLAAMLAHDRRCLLADEPTLGLDRRDTVATIAALRGAADAGRAVVLSTHDLRTAVTVADRVVVLAGGRVAADGPPVAVLRDPEVRRRAGLTLPPLLDWVTEHHAAPAAVAVLRGLDAAVGSDRPVVTGAVR